MKFLGLKEYKNNKEDIIKDVRNLFRLKKTKRDKWYRDIRNVFEHEKENHYQPVRVGNFWSNNYIEKESHNDRNKPLSIEEYLNKIRPYLEDNINYLKKFGTWNMQLIIAINFISSKDNDEKRLKHSESDNMEIMINDKADRSTF